MKNKSRSRKSINRIIPDSKIGSKRNLVKEEFYLSGSEIDSNNTNSPGKSVKNEDDSPEKKTTGLFNVVKNMRKLKKKA